MLALNHVQAFQVVRREPISVVLIDLKLPDMPGLDLVRELRKRGIAAPAIIVMAHGTIDSVVEAMRLGIVDYLQKPVAGRDLEVAAARSLAATINADPDAIDADGVLQWATSIVCVLNSAHDVKTTADWARAIRVAPETLRAWCHTASLKPKQSLDLARVLRAVFQSRRCGCPPGRFLQVAHHRTLERLLAAAGIGAVTEQWTLEEVLAHQSFIDDRVALEELRRVLGRAGFLPVASKTTD